MTPIFLLDSYVDTKLCRLFCCEMLTLHRNRRFSIAFVFLLLLFFSSLWSAKHPKWSHCLWNHQNAFWKAKVASEMLIWLMMEIVWLIGVWKGYLPPPPSLNTFTCSSLVSDPLFFYGLPKYINNGVTHCIYNNTRGFLDIFKGVLYPRPILWLFVHFSQHLQHIGDK